MSSQLPQLHTSPDNEYGTVAENRSRLLGKCLVEPDSAAPARVLLKRVPAVALAALGELLILSAALLWPLFATGTRLIRPKMLTPILPYGGHREPSPPQTLESTSRRVPHGFMEELFRIAVRQKPAAVVAVRQLSAPPPVVVPGGLDDTRWGPAGLRDVPGSEQPRLPAPPPAGQPRSPAPIRRSEGVQSALLVDRVEPRYPPLALATHAEGTVKLHAVIGRDGSIGSLEVLSGNPLFIEAALEAVRRWRYRPTLLGSEPVEVDTYITINFRLSH